MAHMGLMVPYVGMIPGGLMPGKKISIHGMVVPTCNRFSINFQCGPNCNPRDDISLHLNFRFDQQVPYVVRNSLQMQQWGLEEGHGYLSFGRGHTFEITIHVEHDHYKIFFNGQHFSEFRYRIPYNRVTYVTVDGEVVLHAIKIDGYDLHAAAVGPSPYPYGPAGSMPMGHAGSMPMGHAPGSYGFGSRPVPPMGTGVTVTHVYPGYPMTGGHPPSAAIPVHGAAVGAAAMYGTAAYMTKEQKKMAKHHKKEMKKAMKHHKHAKHSHGYYHHGHHKSSSSSSSSEEE